MFTSTLLSFILLPALVSAHGFVGLVTIDGKNYQGNSVGTTATISSVIRQVNTNSPVKGATNPDLNCGASAQLAADVASANPGSTVQVHWYSGTTGTANWIHEVGPVMHYMAECEGSCASYNSSGAKWFKIAEQGLTSGSTWYQAQLASGSPATVTIPSNLAAGNYLLRSEIIALQNAMSQGGAEFYPACIQLSVGGSQTGQPSSSDEVLLPGAYSDSDPGILVNAYTQPLNYVFPGPPVASFIAGGNSTNSTGTSTGLSSTPTPSPPSASSPTGPSPSTPPTSPSATPSPPGGTGGYTPSSAPPSPSTTGGPGSCSYKRSTEAPPAGQGKRMHRRRNRTAH